MTNSGKKSAIWSDLSNLSGDHETQVLLTSNHLERLLLGARLVD